MTALIDDFDSLRREVALRRRERLIGRCRIQLAGVAAGCACLGAAPGGGNINCPPPHMLRPPPPPAADPLAETRAACERLGVRPLWAR